MVLFMCIPVGGTMYQIVSTVYDIYTSSYEDRISIFSEKYPEFASAYPQLFEAVCKPRFNYDRFCDIIERCFRVDKSKKRKRDHDHDDDVHTIIEKECDSMFRSQEHSLKNEYLA